MKGSNYCFVAGTLIHTINGTEAIEDIQLGDYVFAYNEETGETGYKRVVYLFPDKCYCFLQCLFSDDVLLFGLPKDANYIMDGDVGYPSNEWEYLGSDINTFFIRLCQCNGAMYWRW